MRIKSVHIWMLLFAFALAAGCGGVMREEKNGATDNASASTDSMATEQERELRKDSVSFDKNKELETPPAPARSHAFQNFRDFCDLVEIISNKKYALDLRKEALKQAKGIFETPGNEVLLPYDSSGTSVCTVEHFLDHVMNSSFDSINYRINGFSLVDRAGEGGTQDSMILEMLSGPAFVAYRAGKRIELPYHIKKITVRFLKVKKNFGKESEVVWEPKLENISDADDGDLR